MATILGEVTLNDLDIIQVDGDPSLGAGLDAPVGTIAIFAGEGMWQKNGPNLDDWISVYGVNPRSSTQLFDDFLGGGLTSGVIWNYFTANTGTIGLNTTNISGNHPGQIDFSTGTNALGRSGIGGNVTGFLLGGGPMSFEWMVYLPVLSVATQEFDVLAGLGDDIAGADHVDGVYFQYDRTTSANWLLKTSNNSVRTTTISTVPVAAATWYRLRVDVNAAGTQAEFSINGVSVGTLTTNIPTGAGRFIGPVAKIVKSAGTTARLLTIDYFWLRQNFTTPR